MSARTTAPRISTASSTSVRSAGISVRTGVPKDNNWRIVQTIEVGCPKEANAQATVLLTKGVESIGFVIGDKEFSAADLDTLLSGISVKNTELCFQRLRHQKVAGLFIDKMDKEGVDPETVRASFVLDPIVKKDAERNDGLQERAVQGF